MIENVIDVRPPMFDLKNYRKLDAIKRMSIWNSIETLTYIAHQLWQLVPEKTKQRPSFNEFKKFIFNEFKFNEFFQRGNFPARTIHRRI